jgi:uncharacterized protein (TIGR00252 family)
MSTERGRTAEALAAGYLEGLGHAVLDRNWRNRWCELDIVSRSPQGIHIVEVKYRRRTNFGSAIDSITPDKSARLFRGALAWSQAHQYDGPIQIDVISLEGELDQPEIIYIPNVVGN